MGKISESEKQKILHMKAVVISTVACPYVYITVKMIEDNITDIRDFSFVLLTPLCILVHITLTHLWDHSIFSTLFKRKQS